MKLLITGATGFIGSHLARHLADLGHSVHAIVRPGAHVKILDDPRVRLHEHDGTTEQLVELTGSVRPEAALHLASLFLATHRPEDVERLIRSNLLFGAQLLEALAVCDVPYLVNTGTSWQHFEGRAYDPVCLYAATKQAFEQLLEFSVSARGLRVVTLKLFDTYGPRDPRHKLIHALLNAAKTGQPLSLSPGEQTIDLLHIDDAVRGFVAALERCRHLPAPGHERWALSGERCTLRELVARLNHLADKPIPVDWGARPYRDREVMQPWEPPCLLPGWHSTVSLDSGLAQLLRDA